jgi:DNA replication protein DnaC
MSRAHSLTVATIQEQCRGLRLPTVAAQGERLAQEAERANQSHLNYLVEMLGAELEERERRKIERRIKEARLPRMKTLEDFDFSAAAHISVKQIHT